MWMWVGAYVRDGAGFANPCRLVEGVGLLYHDLLCAFHQPMRVFGTCGLSVGHAMLCCGGGVFVRQVWMVVASTQGAEGVTGGSMTCWLQVARGSGGGCCRHVCGLYAAACFHPLSYSTLSEGVEGRLRASRIMRLPNHKP